MVRTTLNVADKQKNLCCRLSLKFYELSNSCFFR